MLYTYFKKSQLDLKIRVTYRHNECVWQVDAQTRKFRDDYKVNLISIEIMNCKWKCITNVVVPDG